MPNEQQEVALSERFSTSAAGPAWTELRQGCRDLGTQCRRKMISQHAALIILATGFAIVDAMPAIADDIGVTPDEMKWEQHTNLGTSVILEGDPAKPGPYVVRLMAPPHQTGTPHTHSSAEDITVISGQLGLGLGPVFDRSKGRVLPPGSFFHLPANTLHFGWTGDEGAVIQAHGMGPFP